MSSAKKATRIVDKNGKETTVWKNIESVVASTKVIDSKPPISTPLNNIISVHNSAGEVVQLSTTEFGFDAEAVYSQGQCVAFAAALSEEFPDSTIKVAMDRSGTILVHAWLEDNDMVIDAIRFDEPNEFLQEEIYSQWGDVEIEDHTSESLRTWFASMGNSRTPQSWDDAERMIPAWFAKNNLG